MHILVIEDEPPNARHLIKLLKELDPAFIIDGPISSISNAVEWLSNHPNPDLILLDIQLADGLSFEIFQEIPLSTPIIFTTAYNQYAIKAFELNSIDYLLKPIQSAALSKAIDKFKSIYQKPAVDSRMAQQLITLLSGSLPKYKSRFLVRSGNKSVVISTNQIAAFYKDELTLILTEQGKKYALDYSLEELTGMLNPRDFFRTNRQCIVQATFIQEIRPEGTQLLLSLSVNSPWQISVSQRNVRSFKHWLKED